MARATRPPISSPAPRPIALEVLETSAPATSDVLASNLLDTTMKLPVDERTLTISGTEKRLKKRKAKGLAGGKPAPLL